MRNLISSYTRFACVVYSGEVKGGGVYEIWHVLCRVGGVGSGTFYSRLIYSNIL